MRRTWWLLGLGIFIVGASAAGWYWMKEDEAPAAAKLSTAEVRKGPMEVKISGKGSIAPAARETLNVLKVGTVDEVRVKEGDEVAQGDVLVTFEQEDIEDRIRSVELDIKRQQLDLTQLQDQYKQADGQAKDSIEVNIKKQMLSVQQLEEEIVSLRKEQGLGPISAPINGKVVSLEVEPGDTINTNTKVAEIVDYRNLQMVVGVDELDIAKVELNQEAEISVEAIPERKYTGKVIKIADEGVTSNGVATFDVTVQLSETDGLKVGMSAEASVVTARKEAALYLPIEAVQSFRGEHFVRVPQAEGEGDEGGGGRGSRIPVEIGMTTEDYVEILTGLGEGEVVVVPAGAGQAQGQSVNGNQRAGAGAGAGGIGGFGGGSFGGGGALPGGVRFQGGGGRP